MTLSQSAEGEGEGEAQGEGEGEIGEGELLPPYDPDDFDPRNPHGTAPDGAILVELGGTMHLYAPDATLPVSGIAAAIAALGACMLGGAILLRRKR